MQLRLRHTIGLALAIGAVYAGTAEAANAAQVEPGVVQALARHGHVDALVTVDYGYVNSPAAGRSLASASRASIPARIGRMSALFSASKKLALADVAGARVLAPLQFLPTSFVRFSSRAALLDVANDPRVRSISLNRSLRVDSAAHLGYIRQPELQAAGNVGSGTYVAVLDSGLDYRSPDFGSCPTLGAPGCRVAEDYEAARPDGQLDDAERHGTNVAAIVSQVAPGAKLLSYDVFDGETSSDVVIARAINHVIQRQQALRKIVAVNLSLGGPQHLSVCSGGLEGAFVGLRNAGIIPVVAAGNAGAKGFGLGSPACLPEALTVGATYDSSSGAFHGRDCSDASAAPDKITCFSQTGQNLDVLAPGAQMAGGGVVMWGTSQATPHVAGAVAVLAAARPTATIGTVESAIVNSGPVLTDTRFATPIARHRLDLVAAFTALGGGSTEPSQPAITRGFTPYGVINPTANTIPVTFSWSSSSSKGIRSYNVWIRTSGDPTAINQAQWSNAGLAPSASTVSWALEIGKTYQVGIRATDGFGRISGWSYSTATVDLVDDTQLGAIRRWTRTPSTAAYGGTAIASKRRGTALTLTYSGTDIALIAPKYAGAGLAAVSVDGFRYPVDLNASTLQPRVSVFTQHYDQQGTHRIKIAVASGRIDIDAFALLK